MKTEYVMGNAAIALGALAAGAGLAAGYPGTPSSEIIETIAKFNDGNVHVEWSVNEKAALEVAAAASYSGARTLVTMKQVGLNVASDPLMSLAYVGVEGGMVIVSADDPGPISSQTEQDTRRFASFARIPVFDPASPEEAYQMIQDAFACSEKYHTPVLFRPTTRVCHAYASIEIPESFSVKTPAGFVKNSNRWVIFPRLSFANHTMIEKRNPEIGEEYSSYRFNTVEGDLSASKAILTGGISYAYVKEILRNRKDVKLIRVATPYPVPERFLLQALEGVQEVLCIEELSPVLEEAAVSLTGLHHLPLTVLGKRSGHIPHAGENSADSLRPAIAAFTGAADCPDSPDLSDMPALPVRPPVLCAGCPHRASFYAVKAAMKGKKANFCGDIGCYTLGNAMPLDMVDTCLCMGAGVTMAQGLHWINPDAVNFAFIGDSTFFASGITGVVNALYNQARMVLVVLDNSTTAMTGHQPHPGTGKTMMGDIVTKIDLVKILEGMGVQKIRVTDPLDLSKAVETVKDCAATEGVSAIIFKSPCVAITKPDGLMEIGEDCIQCHRCIREIGCPGLVIREGKVAVDAGLCTGCGLCAQLCPKNAIHPAKR